jgi:hypothetical protein
MTINGTLVYDNEHEKAGQAVEPAGPCLMSYDTKTFKVTDYHNFGEDFSLLALKAAAINALESFTHNYVLALGALNKASEECAKRQRSGRVVIDSKGMLACIGRANTRLDAAISKIVDWDGKGEIHLMIPYAVVAAKDSKHEGEPPIVDTDNSQPYVNGMMFLLKGW